MAISEFLKNVTGDEIRRASDEADLAEDAANGSKIEKGHYVNRMDDRLLMDYPGLHQRIKELVEGSMASEHNKAFLVGVWAGATMFAHDITIAAERHDASRSFEDPTD